MDIKKDYGDTILMYRLGDFYEMFFDDALLASRVLELTLTGRNCGLEERAPMCGVPHHSVDQYIVRLVNAGHKVAICEQVEDPAEAKGIVKREIVKIYTPGTLDISGSDEGSDNVYIASLAASESEVALAVCDITTGDFTAYEYAGGPAAGDGFDDVISGISVLGIKEIVLPEESAEALERLIEERLPAVYINRIDDSYYRLNTCRSFLMSHFEVSSLVPLDLEGRDELTSAAGSLLMYLKETQKNGLEQISALKLKQDEGIMHLDRQTLRNLELLETLYDHDINGSLLGVIDKTRTAMGGRKIRSWIREPLTDIDEIMLRLDAVDALKGNPISSNNMQNSLRFVYDFRRLSTRIATKRADARDLIALKKTIGELPDIKEELMGFEDTLLKSLYEDIPGFENLYNLIENSIEEEPPVTVTEGGIIKRGFSPELDRLKDSIKDAKDWIANLENSEKERTGIKTLKVGYNKVFGYYIDVSKSMADKVPDDYIRKQTLVNNERYITPELKEKEDLVFSAENRINKLEYDEFKKIREAAEPYVHDLQKAADAIGVLDVLLSFAKVSSENNYVKPSVDEGDVIDIKAGRHPAVEKLLGAGMFVSNDTLIDLNERSMLIITGPNMSGKSTYMRQTAIIVLMAQIGCFVPASDAHIGIVDRIFTRIGASDNLSSGQSTFYIEMSELAGILRNASEKSLIILDEIGRGTSTFDGLSIAWATADYLADPNHRVRTMFATHYHELTDLEAERDSVCNLSVAAAEDGSDVVFLHNILEGPASKSYGIHVAKIAGIPEVIRKSAKAKLTSLEEGSRDAGKAKAPDTEQLSFMPSEISSVSETAEISSYNEIRRMLTDIDTNRITPIEALIKIQELKDVIDDN